MSAPAIHKVVPTTPDYDAALNSAGWKLVSSYKEIVGSPPQPRFFNFVKEILRASIEEWVSHFPDVKNESEELQQLTQALAEAQHLLVCNAWIREENENLKAENESLRLDAERLDKLINIPEIFDFQKGVQLESAHQRDRWASDHDAGKTPADWFWLIGHLAGKALLAQTKGITGSALHHVITTAAALSNWHASILGKTNMRPGIEEPAEYAQPFKTSMLAGARMGHPERPIP